MSDRDSDNDLTAPRSRVDVKYAIYHDAEDHGWMVDTGVGGTWSWDVDEAAWFNSTDDALTALVACDFIEVGSDPAAQRFHILRVR